MKINKQLSDAVYNRYLELRAQGKFKKGVIQEILRNEFNLPRTSAWDHSVGRFKGSVNAPIEPEVREPVKWEPRVSSMPSLEYKKLDNKKKTYIITGWEIRIGVNDKFISCLNKLSDHLDAEKLLVPVWMEDVDFMPEILKENFKILTDNRKFNDNLIFHYVPTHALVQSPLTGWRGAFPGQTAILPGLVKELISEPSVHLCKQLISTGSVGRLDAGFDQYNDIDEETESYSALKKRWNSVTSRAMGKTTAIAQMFIKPSALIVDIISNKIFVTRFVTMEEDGVIYDLDKKIHYKDGISKSNPLGLVTGDYHFYQYNPTSHKATIEMIREFNPEKVVLNDFFDGASLNYHDVNSEAKIKDAPSVDEEARVTKDGLRQICDEANHVIYLQSNHDNFIDKYLDTHESNWRLGGNYVACCELQAYRLRTGNPPIMSLLEIDKFDNLTFVREDEDHYIGLNILKHGHEVYRGGGLRYFAKTYNNVIIGHTHNPGIFRNSVNVGTNSVLKPSYAIGDNGSMGANALIQPDNSVQLLPIIEGKWRR